MSKKQIIKLFMWVLIGGVFGFILGYIDGLTGIFSNIGLSKTYLIENKIIFVFLHSIITIVLIVVTIIFNNIKKQIKNDNYNDDENSAYSKKTSLLNITLTIASSSIFINMMFMGISTYYTNEFLNTTDVLIYFVIIVIFLINVIYGSMLEVQYVNLIKSVQNEKNADPTALNYPFKRIETLDEQELLNEGKCALKTIVVNQIYVLILFLLGIFTRQAPFYYITVLSIPIVNIIAFMYFGNRK